MDIIDEINEKYHDGITFVSTKIKQNKLIIQCKHGKENVEFVFEHYCSYMVRQEVTASDDVAKIDMGKIITKNEKSWFIKQVKKHSDFLFKPIVHYRILCEFEVIDVASYTEIKYGEKGNK